MIWDIIEDTSFDHHFSDPNLQIDTLLLDENIITEFKNLNPKLLELYACIEMQCLTAQILIEYSIIMPKMEDGYDRCHRLPYISSQILAIDSELIYASFFGNSVYWDKLLGFITTSAIQNDILLGYFKKIVINLYNGNKIQTTKIIHQHIDSFIKVIEKESIGDIISNSLILLFVNQGAVLDERIQIINKIAIKLVQENQDVRLECSQILVDVISKFQTFSSGDKLLETILNSQNVAKIYEIRYSAAVTKFIIGLLWKANQKVIGQNDIKQSIITIPPLHKEKINSYLSQFSKDVFNDYHQSKANQYPNQSKKFVRKINSKLLLLIHSLNLALQNQIYQFTDQNLIQNCWQIVSEHPFNNILIVSVIKFFTLIDHLPPSKLKESFSQSFFQNTIGLAEINLKLFRPHLFTLWKQCKSTNSLKVPQELTIKWNQLVKNELQPQIKYDISANSVKRQHHVQKKLIVDEEDTSAAPKTQKTQIQTKLAQVPQISADPFDFWQIGTSVSQVEKEEKKQQKKNIDFADFSEFF